MLTNRSQEKELIDLGESFYSHAEYSDCLKKLFRVSKLFGFFYSTVAIIKRLATHLTILDVGCGGGLFLLHLGRLFPTMSMLGIDISKQAIFEAQNQLQTWRQTNVNFKIQEEAILPRSFDVILLTLVCHHLSDEELIHFLQEVSLGAKKMVIINDLHRHPLAIFFYRLLSPILFNNRLITHDGVISIRRGFTRIEWLRLLRQAGIENYQLTWRFPFRWQLILFNRS